MPRRSLKKLAGCIGIELLVVAAGAAADFRAGFAAAGQAQALAIEDRRGNRAVILNVDFPVPLAVADPIAAEVLKSYGLDRAALLFRSTGSAVPAPRDAVAAVGAALGEMEPARMDFGQGLLQISTQRGCHALDENSFFALCGLALSPVKGPIRSAFRVVDVRHGLERRTDIPQSCYVQAIALGTQVVILSAPENFLHSAAGRILAATPAVDAPPEDIQSAISDVLARVSHK